MQPGNAESAHLIVNGLLREAEVLRERVVVLVDSFVNLALAQRKIPRKKTGMVQSRGM